MVTIEQITKYVLDNIQPVGGDNIDDIPLTSDLGKKVIAKVAESVAKYHVESAIAEAYDKAKLSWNGTVSSATYTIEPYNTFYDSVTIGIDRDSIYKAYPLENIK